MKQKKTFYGILASLITIDGILAFQTKQTPYFNFDLTITQWIQSHSSPQILLGMQLISELGNILPALVLIIITSLILLWYKKQLEAITLIISTTGALLISITTKLLIGRDRPNPDLIMQIGNFTKQDSFPSGHVLFFVGFFGFLLFLTYKLLPKNILKIFIMLTLLLLLILIGVSRIYLGAHWFSDVIGAYIIGFVWVSIISLIYNRIVNLKHAI